MAFALPVSLTPTEEKADCFRLLSLVVDGGTLALRHRFDQLITPSDLQNTLNDTNTRGKLNALLNKRVLTNAQWNLLYPTTGRPCSDRFDVSLLYCLLKHICGLNEQSTSWNGVPPSFDTTVEADVNRLKQYRNDVSHLISISLNKGDFNRKWTKIEKVITRLGAGLPNLQQEIQNLKENSIDPEKEKFYQNKIAEWKKMDESLKNEIDYLKIEVHDNKETLEALKETVEDNENCCSENSRNIQVLEQKHQKHFEHAEQKLQTIEETITTLSLQSRVQESSISETRNIPTTGNTASVTNFYIEDIERDDVYVTTQAHKKAKEKFNLTGCLILSGLPGEGKTTMATKLISETTPKGFCRKLNCPADWKDVLLNNETPVTIFIDDIFGAGAVNGRLLEDWSQLLPDVDKAIKAKAIKAMITTRHYIFKEAKEKLKFLKILRDDNVQILSSCDLTDDERIEMLKNHLIHSKREYNADLIEECNSEYEQDSYFMGSIPSEFREFKAMIGFPEIVNLFVKNDHLYSQGSNFFREPFLFFKKCIEEIFLDKEKSLALILVWTRPGKKLFVADVESPNISKEIKETVAKFGFELGSVTTETICMSLEYHKDGFLYFNSYDGTYGFSHNTVKDMVGLVVGKEHKTLVLQFIESDIEFLKQFVTTDKKKDDGLHIYMEPFRLREICKVVCKAMDAKEPNNSGMIFRKRNFIIYERFQTHAHFTPGPNELSVRTSLLELDSFNNKVFVKIFCESNEGQFILSRPVEMMPQKCLGFGCDLDFGESFAIYLPTLALLYKSSLLIKRVLQQHFQCIHTTDFIKSTLLIASQCGFKDVLELLVQRGVIVDENAIFLASANTNNESLEYLLQNFTGDCTECPNSTNKNSPLIAAAKNDNREAVDCIKTLIRHGCNVNYRNKNGWSALDKAVMYAAPESCKILLDNGASVKDRSAKFKRTPLHINADVGNASITSILLEHGLVVNVKDYRGHYPVQCAAFSDNVDVVDILLKADLSKVTQKHRVSYGKNSRIKGSNLYHIAVLNQSVKLIECLLQNNVCPNVRDFYGRTPLYVAVYGFEKKDETRRLNTSYEKKQYDVIKKLSEHSDAHIADHNGYTPLHAAVHKGNIEVVKLLAPQCDVNARDKHGKTPLHTACDRVDFEIFKVLVEDYRADYRMRTKAGHSIFDILARKTEWRNIRRRYQNRQHVTKYMVEYPRLRSFKEVFEKKDHTFQEEVTKDIVLSGHPKDILFTELGYDPDEYFKEFD